MNVKSHVRPPQALYPIDFLVVGGGISGLTCAVALRRVGHRVLVLEDDEEDEKLSGGCRLPPNLTKILIRWGLGEELRAIAVTSGAINFHLYETGEFLGTHVWDGELMKEAGGDWMFAHHADVRKLLYDTAISYGTKIRRRARVVDIDSDEGSVTLESGEVLRAHVIIGADGVDGLAREQLLEEEGKLGPRENSSGLMMFNTTIPKKLMMMDTELRYFYDQKYTIFVWYGHGRCALGFPVGGSDDFAVHIYVPHDGSDMTWHEKASVANILPLLGDAEPRMEKLAKLATPPACISMKDVPELENWVHDSGRMVLVGDAAHPLPPGVIQNVAMAIEDAAVLGKIFSHLLREDQISTFLYAFQDIRQDRVAQMLRNENFNIEYMTLPECEQQQLRDNGTRMLSKQGVNVMKVGEVEEHWEDIKTTFAYDCEDEADNWWVNWGLLRERADGRGIHSGIQELTYSVCSMQDLTISPIQVTVTKD